MLSPLLCSRKVPRHHHHHCTTHLPWLRLQQPYGRDAAVTSLARSMPALQGLTYEGTGNGLGIGYGMMQSHSLNNSYMVRAHAVVCLQTETAAAPAEQRCPFEQPSWVMAALLPCVLQVAASRLEICMPPSHQAPLCCHLSLMQLHKLAQ